MQLDVDAIFLNFDEEPFTTQNCGLDRRLFPGQDEDPPGPALPVTVGAVLKATLLFTLAPEPGQPRNQPPPVIHPDEKFERTAIALKIRQGGLIDLTDKEVKLVLKAISVLPTEPYGMLRVLLTPPA